MKIKTLLLTLSVLLALCCAMTTAVYAEDLFFSENPFAEALAEDSTVTPTPTQTPTPTPTPSTPETPKKTIPATGDVASFASVGALAASGVIALIASKKRK